jgi:hypothetical protein
MMPPRRFRRHILEMNVKSWYNDVATTIILVLAIYQVFIK